MLQITNSSSARIISSFPTQIFSQTGKIVYRTLRFFVKLKVICLNYSLSWTDYHTLEPMYTVQYPVATYQCKCLSLKGLSHKMDLTFDDISG